MSFIRKNGESIKEYKVRLCKNKVVYGITFDRIAELINKETGESKSEGFFRRWWNGYNEGYTDGESNSLSDDLVLEKYRIELEKLEKEKVKFYDYRSAYKKSLREDSREEALYDIIVKEIKNIKPYTCHITPIRSSENDLFIGLNDIHFGVEIDNHWNKYDSKIAKKRLELYLSNIFKIANTHNSQNCYVCANGDLISGNIHPTIQIANRENVVEQVIGVSELISWFLSELSYIFKHVAFSVVSGNHSRLSTKDNSPLNERLDDLIPWYMKARLQNIKNIEILDKSIDGTLNIVDIRGLNYLNVHGDYDGFNNIQKLIEMVDKPIYCVHFGHLHHNATNSIQKYKVIMSGSLQGVDDYCIQKRIYGRAEQLVCVCDSSGIVCNYNVDLQINE